MTDAERIMHAQWLTDRMVRLAFHRHCVQAALLDADPSDMAVLERILEDAHRRITRR